MAVQELKSDLTIQNEFYTLQREVPYKAEDEKRKDVHLQRVILMPPIQSGTSFSEQSLSVIADEVQRVATVNGDENESFSIYEAKLVNALEAGGENRPKGQEYVMSYMESVKAYRENIRPIVILPTSKDIRLIKLYDHEKQDELDRSVRASDNLQKEIALHKSNLAEESVLGIPEITEEQSLQIRLQFLNQKIDLLINSRYAECPQSGRTKSIISYMQLQADPSTQTISLFNDISAPFKNYAQIRGPVVLSISEKLDQMKLPNELEIGDYRALVIASTCELVLEQAAKDSSVEFQAYKKFLRAIYAILPININSPVVDGVLKSVYGSYFPRLQELKNLINKKH